MFKTKCKKTVSKMILSFILITVTLLSGCQKNSTHSAIEFGTIDVSEIDKIELSGTTGGKDGNFSYTLSDQEKKEFVHLLNQVELGDEVDKNQALLSGAVTYYKLYFQGKDVVTLCPGHYFGVDEKEHIRLTGHTNKNILDLATYLSDMKKPVWIRHVLVPKRSDKDEYLDRLHEFILTLHNVERVEVLPYHTLGAYKWKELGMEYPLEGIDPPTAERVENVRKRLGAF